VRPDVAVVETLTAVIGIQKPSPGMSLDTGHGEGWRRMEDRCLPQHGCEAGCAGTRSPIGSRSQPVPDQCRSRISSRES
jgi:hypothetical protein